MTEHPKVNRFKVLFRWMKGLALVAFVCLAGSLLQFNLYLMRETEADFRQPANQDAPIYVEQKMTLSAPSDTVLSILADIPNWPDWHPLVAKVRANYVLFGQGIEFDYWQGEWKYSATLHTYDGSLRIGWFTDRLGDYRIQNWTCKPTGEGTEVTIAYSRQGIIPWLFQVSGQRRLEDQTARTLKSLQKVTHTKATDALRKDE